MISAFGTEIYDEIDGKPVDEWPVSGWREGLRMGMFDQTGEKINEAHRSLEVEGMTETDLDRLLDMALAELKLRCRRHLGKVLSEYRSYELTQMRKSRALKLEYTNERKTIQNNPA